MKRALSEAFARYGMSVSVLHGGERRYVVRAAGPFYVGEEIAYYWAMLHPKEEEA